MAEDVKSVKAAEDRFASEALIALALMMLGGFGAWGPGGGLFAIGVWMLGVVAIAAIERALAR